MRQLLSEISRDNNVILSHRVLLQILNYKKRIRWLTASNTGVSRRHEGSLIKKIQLFVYIHFPHSDYFINCPAFISSLPIPPNNQPLYPDQQTHHWSFVDSKDLLSPLKEPPFFDDWAAANFKVINLISDWLAAHQSPYQSLRSDPSVFRYTEEIRERGATEEEAGTAPRALPPRMRTFIWITTFFYFSFWFGLFRPEAGGRLSTMAAVAVLRNETLQAFLQVGAPLSTFSRLLINL